MSEPPASASVISIDELHQMLYGYVPKNPGTAYERLAAAVFAQLGWVDVEHDRLEQTPGGTAIHQLDFICRRPDGTSTRLMASCKNWNKKVGKQEMDTWFGVQTQLQWDEAAVITQIGFTRGARKVATDQRVAMVRLRLYDRTTDDGRWWSGVRTTISWPFASILDVKLHPAHDSDTAVLDGIRIQGWMNVATEEGKPAETFDELWRRGILEQQPDGKVRGRLALTEPRFVYALDGSMVPITGMEWTVYTEVRDITTGMRAQGQPVFWFEELDSSGKPKPGAGKVIVDAQLKLWDFDGKRLFRNDQADESWIPEPPPVAPAEPNGT